MANLPLAFAELLAGAVIIDAAIKGASLTDVVKGQASTQSGGLASYLTGAGSSGQGTGGGITGASSGSPSAMAMLTAASAAATAKVPYSTSVQSSGLLAGFRSDCSGFVSWVLNKGGVNVGDATTVTLPGSSGIQAGEGSQVTLWNRPEAGQEGHVIIDILGSWFESGGQNGGGIVQMTTSEVEQELGVSDLSSLGNSATPNGFSPLHPSGL